MVAMFVPLPSLRQSELDPAATAGSPCCMNLVEVHFAEADKTVLVQPGTTLLDAAEMAGVDVMSGCTRGMCGTDAHRVEASEDALESPGDAELGTLERMGLGAGARLLCCAKVRSGKVTVIGDALTG